MHFLKTVGAPALAVSVLLVLGGTADATAYNVATDFEAGYIAQTNPNGVWSYGYSAGFTSPVTLYSSTTTGLNGPKAQYWLTPAINIGDSPAAEYNDGPAYNDGNVAFAANQFLLVAGIGGEFSDLIFTAPVSDTYTVDSSFLGDQGGIGTVVAVIEDGTDVLFNSSVTSEGQNVPFDTVLSLAQGDTVELSVGPGGGLQNTGVDLTISSPSPAAVPEPASLTLLGAALLSFGVSRRRRLRRGQAL